MMLSACNRTGDRTVFVLWEGDFTHSSLKTEFPKIYKDADGIKTRKDKTLDTNILGAYRSH